MARPCVSLLRCRASQPVQAPGPVPLSCRELPHLVGGFELRSALGPVCLQGVRKPHSSGASCATLWAVPSVSMDTMSLLLPCRVEAGPARGLDGAPGFQDPGQGLSWLQPGESPSPADLQTILSRRDLEQCRPPGPLQTQGVRIPQKGPTLGFFNFIVSRTRDFRECCFAEVRNLVAVVVTLCKSAQEQRQRQRCCAARGQGTTTPVSPDPACSA